MSDAGVAFWSEPGDHHCNACGGSHSTMAEVMTCSPPSGRGEMMSDHASESYEQAIVRLEAENAKLREALGWMINDFGHYDAEISLQGTIDRARAVYDGAPATTTEAREPTDG